MFTVVGYSFHECIASKSGIWNVRVYVNNATTKRFVVATTILQVLTTTSLAEVHFWETVVLRVGCSQIIYRTWNTWPILEKSWPLIHEKVGISRFCVAGKKRIPECVLLRKLGKPFTTHRIVNLRTANFTGHLGKLLSQSRVANLLMLTNNSTLWERKWLLWIPVVLMRW